TINILPNGRAYSTLKMKRDNQKWRGGKPAPNSNNFFDLQVSSCKKSLSFIHVPANPMLFY
ncbi:MAG TPA: hypothetical protein PLR24_11915, partial [Saprospiraceae bacterium]|nr:hypothetical protein [Saprospiraceae bacterium]